MMEFRDSDESSRLSTDAIRTQLNSTNSSPVDSKCTSLNASLNASLINNNNNNSSSSTNSTATTINLTSTAQLTLRSNEVHTVILYGVPIIALVMDNVERLCLAQISNTLLKDFSYNEIHNRRVALGINCVQCTPVQLELLRRAGAMPVSSRRCGMITKREAERLCKSFLQQTAPPNLPENYEFQIYHRCSYGAAGSFVPTRYNSSRAKCIKCHHCHDFFSPNKFIFHSHRERGGPFVEPDAANFNSWRRHIKLVEGAPDHVLNVWEEVKAMFNGGSRKRAMSATLNSVSKQQQHQKQQMTRNLVSNSLISVANGTTSAGLHLSNSRSGQSARKLSNHLTPKSRSSKNLPMPDLDEDEELIVDDDYKPSSGMQQNLLNSQLFASANAHLDDGVVGSGQMGSSSPAAIQFNLLANCQNNKMLNQPHPLAAFAPFQTNGAALNNLGSPMPTGGANCVSDLSLQLNAPNAANLASHRTSALNGRANGGQLDVVQAMLPMLGQEFIWPPHHPLNSLTQLSSLSCLPNQACSPGLPPSATHLSTMLPRQPPANGSLPSKSAFPILYNTPSLLFTHHTGSPGAFNNQPVSKNSLPENWLNKNAPIEAAGGSAFKKVNTTNKMPNDSHFVPKKSGGYNDFSVENLSKGKKLKGSSEPKRVKEEEEVDVEGTGDELNRKKEMKNEQEAKLDENESNYREHNDLKVKLSDRLGNRRKKANSLGGERPCEELSDCGSPIRSQSASETNKSLTVFNLVGEAAATCQADNCQLPCCNKRSPSSTSQLLNNGNTIRNEPIDSENKLVDLSNVNTLIKGQEARLNGSKELDLVNIMAFNNLNKLNEVMNKNYPSNEVLLKEELEKRIQLIEYIRNSFNTNKLEYVHQKLN